ncbi:MAG: hypothetical protein ACLP8X_00605 [Streptosporangiaceae bacterium]|jgi:hypothetical protein
MLTFAADFWPLFWTIIGAGALVTVMLSLLVATFSPTWFRSHQRHQPTLTPVEPGEQQAGHHYQAGQEAKAA